MSLKTFHAFFIGAATLLALFCALQAFATVRAGSVGGAAAGVASLAAAVMLVRYEAAFLRRSRAAGERR